MPNGKINDERVLRAFVDKMIIDKDPSIDNVNRTALRKALGEMLDVRIEEAMIGALPDDKLIEADALLTANASDEEVERLFAESGVDYAKAVERAMKAFREEYLRGEIVIDMTEALAQVSPMQAEAPMENLVVSEASILNRRNTQAQTEQQNQPTQAQPETPVQAQAGTQPTVEVQPATEQNVTAQPAAQPAMQQPAQPAVSVETPTAQGVEAAPVTQMAVAQPEPVSQPAAASVAPESVPAMPEPVAVPVVPDFGQALQTSPVELQVPSMDSQAPSVEPQMPPVSPVEQTTPVAESIASAMANPTIITPMTGEEN